MHHDVSHLHLAHVDHSPVLFAVGSLAWAGHVLWEGLPPWSLVPALVFAGIAAVKAGNDHLDRRQRRRHAEELHQARLRDPLPFAIGFDHLDSR